MAAADHGPDLEAAAAFVLRLRARGIRDLAVLRAMETTPRLAFVPERYADLASRDAAVPIPCGQTMSEPFVVARMLEGLGVTPECRVLEVGSGSGYATAVLARLAREVLAVERIRTLAQGARTRLAVRGIANVGVHWGDGLGVPPEAGPFDRVLIHALLPEGPAAFAELMTEGGVLVCARLRDGAQLLMRHARTGDGWTESALCNTRLRPLLDGPSAML